MCGLGESLDSEASDKTMRKLSVLQGISFALVLTVLVAASANAQTLPSGFAESRFAYPVTAPTAMGFAPDGRLFVLQQGGQIRVVKNGTLLTTPFAAVDAEMTGEHGLVGITFDPNFSTNQYIYVYYIAKTPTIHARVSRFTAAGDVADGSGETIVMELEDTPYNVHVGGAMHFAADGTLFIATGENSVSTNAQSLNTVKGKLLRINADGTIPASNPFYAITSGINRAIWALGLRNPFTFAFQPLTGRLFINDVGNASFEELNEGVAARNFGWPVCEGPCSPQNGTYTDPIYSYPHSYAQPLACAVTGGDFYSPAAPQFPADYTGKYFFLDYCGAWLKYIDTSTYGAQNFGTGLAGAPIALTTGPDGSLYYISRSDDDGSVYKTGNGAIYKIAYTGVRSPQIGQNPDDQLVPGGGTARFLVRVSGDAPLTYQWQRNGVNIPGATSSTYITPTLTLADSGSTFSCVVTNAFGTATSTAATLTVTPNQPPVPTIVDPPDGTLYSAGDTITYSGTGTDPEDGTLPPSGFTWEVRFQHDTHYHPFIAPTSGATGGSFTIPTTGEASSNVWYRIILTVTDSAGISRTTFRDVLPRKSTVTLASDPTGLQMTLDGTPVVGPYSFVGVVGVTRTIGVVSPQTSGPTIYEFDHWSDGGAANHSISTPAVDTAYTATYRVKTAFGSISATPNPIQICNGSGTAVTTLTWTTSGVSIVEIHIGSPTGTLFGRTGAGTFSATTGNWATQGMTFYLQNVSGGLPLTAANTLATVQVNFTTSGCANISGTIAANPNPVQVCDGSGIGVTTVNWTSTGATIVEIHVGSPSGTLFGRTGVGWFSQTTGKWVNDGMTFYLQNVSGGLPLTAANTLATVSVRVRCAPTITWNKPADIVYGTALGAAQLNATANVPGSFVYSPPTGSVLTAGTQTLSTTFTPLDTTTYSVTTATVSLNVLKATPTVTWAKPADIVYGTPIGAAQLNATAGVPGTFLYSPGPGVVLTGGAQTLSTTFTPTDTTNYSTATSSVSLTVARAPLTIKADDKTKTFGAPLPGFTASAAGFVNGDTIANLVGQLVFATTAIPTSPVGAYPITPGGLASSNYIIVFANGTLSIVPATPTVALASNPNPSSLNQAITLTATAVGPGGSVPTGIVSFFDGATLLGASSLSNAGIASIVVNGLASGTHGLTAAYQGDAAFSSSTSPASAQVVNAAANSTTTTLSSNPDPANLGQNVTITAKVVRQSGTSTVTGTVQFFELVGGAPVGSATLNNGTASLKISTLAAGTHFIVGRYQGGGTAAGSDSTPLAVGISDAPKLRSTSTSLTSSANPSAFGAAATFTVRSTGKNMSGDVLLTIDGIVAGQVALTPINSDTGTATFQISGLTRGTHTVAAEYVGNATLEGSVSTEVRQQVQ